MASSQVSFRSLVRKADPDWDEKHRRPVAYKFSKGKTKYEVTASSGPYTG